MEHKSTLNLTDKDKDIIKALELCFAEKGTKQTCGECPYHQFGELCKVKRGRDTLDLINRQQAENDNWEKQFRILDVECSRLEKKTEEQQAEIERLKKQHRLNLLEQLDIAEQIKAEAIKEFAERFINLIHTHQYILCDKHNSKDYGMFTNGIEQAVNETKKEMAGDTE